jgi:hypothetical protein
MEVDHGIVVVADLIYSDGAKRESAESRNLLPGQSALATIPVSPLRSSDYSGNLY